MMNTIIEAFVVQVNENEKAAAVFDNDRKLNRKRVEVCEVENVLVKSGYVKQAYVAPKMDDNKLSYMVAYIVKEKDEVGLSDITEYMRDYLTDFMIPEYFVVLNKLPLNANGKVDKAALPNVLRKVAA